MWVKPVEEMPSTRSLAVWTATNLKSEEVSQRSILDSLKSVVKFSDIFGFLPLFMLSDAADERCPRWRRVARVSYVVFVIFTIHLLALLNFAEYFSYSLEPHCTDISCYMRRYTGVSFNLCCITSSLYFATVGLRRFWAIAKRWDRISQRFNACFGSCTARPTEFYLQPKYCLRFVCLYYGMVITEHLLQDMWLIHGYVQNNDRFNGTKPNFFYSLFNDSYPLTYVVLHYVPGSEMWMYVGGKYKVIAWNYNDFLVVAIGLALNRSLSAFNGQLKTISSRRQWKKARKIHLELCELVDMVDDFLSPVILLTLGVTIYFVCNQIFFHLHPNDQTLLRALYSSMSIALLSARAAGTIMVSSQIHEQGKGVLTILRSCPTELYDIEVERFWDQAVDFPMALSGAKLFYINRRFFLTTVSVVLTYELVFLGFI